MSAPDRGEMLDRADKALSIRRQCALLCVARSSVYRAKRPANDNDLILMRRIDELFTAYPFYGSRRMTLQLRSEGHDINRKRVQRIMRTMGIVALGPKPNTSKPAPGHKIYPYLLRGLKIERPNHVWCADITYISIGRGFLYLVALMDWASRAVLSWRLSNTMDASFCVEALEEALAKYGKPEIFNTDQGSQFTGMDFTGVLLEAGIQISMDGRGRWMDNVFIERLWRSLKHEDIYLKHYADGHEAKAGISAWIDFYNTKRFHRALRNRAPMAVQHDGAAALAGAGCGYVTTQERCPQTHSSRRSLWRHDKKEKERTRFPTRNHPPLVLMTGSTSIRYVIILKSSVEIIRTNIQKPLASASQVNCGSTDGNHSIANRVSASPLLERCRVTSTVFRGAIATERHNSYAPFISMRHFYMRHL